MAVEQVPDYTGFELYRPVIDGAGRFLNKLRHVGGSFGDDGTTAIMDAYRLEDALLEGEEEYVPNPTHKILRTIGNPKFKEVNLEAMRMNLYSVYLPADAQYARLMLLKADDKLFPAPYPRPNAIRQHPRQGITAELRQAGLPYDIVNQEMINVWFNRADVRPSLLDGQAELVLLPDPADPVTKMLHVQADICMHGIHNSSRRLRQLIEKEGNGLAVPVAKLAQNMHPSERKEAVRLTEELLPLRMVLGGIKHSISGTASVRMD